MRKDPKREQLNMFVPKQTKKRLIRMAKKLDTTQARLVGELIESKYSEVYKK